MDRAVGATLARWTAETIIAADGARASRSSPRSSSGGDAAIEARPVRARALGAAQRRQLEAPSRRSRRSPSAPSTTIDEVVVVVVGVSGSMQTPFGSTTGACPPTPRIRTRAP